MRGSCIEIMKYLVVVDCGVQCSLGYGGHRWKKRVGDTQLLIANYANYTKRDDSIAVYSIEKRIGTL